MAMRITRAGVVFVLGIIILAGLVFAGIWYVNQRGEQARRNEAIKIAEQQLEEQSKVAKETNTDPVKTDTNQNNTSTETKPTVTELPTTGAEPLSILIVALLALATSFYVSSQRAVSRL